jgi:surface protein
LKLPAKVNAVTDMSNMFYQCRALTELDLSAWNTNLVTKMDGMFNMGYYAGALAKIYVGDGWTVAKVTSSADMFKNCTSLPGCNGVDNIDASYAKSTAEGGYLTKK